MPTVSAPYGLIPQRALGNRPFNAPSSGYRIPSGYNTNLFFGQPVAFSGGAIIPAVAGFSGYIGIFMGCSYQDPTFGFVNRQYWPANTVTVNAAAATAFVADDPDVMLQTQLSVASFDADANIGRRYNLNLPAGGGAGNTATGNSLAGVTGTFNATGEFLILGRVDKPDNANATGFVDVFGVIAAGLHAARRP